MQQYKLDQMTFLELIGGLRYEEQTSAVLQYLFINSDTFRRAFVDRISGEFAPTTVPRFASGIFCHREVTDTVSGRIDLLVEADNCFLAIENKIWADFQDNQPARYAEIVKASYLNAIKNNYRIILIAPSQTQERIDQIKQEQQFDQNLIVVYWQDIQKHMLKPVREHDSPRMRVVAELLDEFIDQQVGQFANLNFPRERLVGVTAEITNQYQRDFLYAIKSSFSDFDLSRMGFGRRTYGGFYFSFKDAKPANWFGFHASEQGTVLQFHLYLDHTPTLQSADWSLTRHSKAERRYEFTFTATEWPADRVDWDDRINPILKMVKECTDMDTPDEELTT